MVEHPTQQPMSIAVGPVPWPNLPRSGGARLRTLVRRALGRRCPYCGGGNIFSGYFSLKPICPTCEVEFEREDGYFLGGYALNLVVSEFLALALAVWLIFRTPLKEWSLLPQEVLAISLAVAIPVVLFPFSRTMWMAIDLTLNPPRENQEEYLRGRDLRRHAEQHAPRQP